jgi:hypothetical protein
LVETRELRRRRTVLLALVVLPLTVLALAAAVAVVYFAYDRQSDRIAELETENTKIESDHSAIGAQFAQQSRELERTLKRVDQAYAAGFRAGRQSRLPPRLRPLEAFAASGFLIPRRVPRPFAGRRLVTRRDANGYVLRWGGVALFASGRDPLSVWTRTAWPGSRRTVRIGRRQILRFWAATGVTYAWSEGGRTYAVLAMPRRDQAARQLITTLA